MLYTQKIISGHFKAFSINNIPIYIHWSFPAGGIFLSWFVGFKLQEVIYYCLSYTSLILIHEIGHLSASAFLKYKVFAIFISGFSGECYIERPNTIKHAFLVYSSGLLFQLAALIFAASYYLVFGNPDSLFGKSLLVTYTVANIIIMIINIIPSGRKNGLQNDGRILWRLIRGSLQKGPLPFILPVKTSRIYPPETKLLDIKGFKPKNFKTGIEILNDDTTPMEFVVSTLKNTLNLSDEKAIQYMLEIHQWGGKVISLSTTEKSEQAADSINADSKKHGYNFICRPIP